jgi:hypothetical protein
MQPPLIVRLLLDAEIEFVRAAGAVPQERREVSQPGLNAAGWVIAHAGFFHDVWISADGQGRPPREACDPWLRDWFRRQQAAGKAPIDAPFADARAGLGRVLERTTPYLRSLTDQSLEVVPAYEEGAWPAGTTAGYLVARAVAHLFAHASELNVISTSAGGTDIGLPGRLSQTRGG